MDHSDWKTKSSSTEQSVVMLRALTSAAIFGTLGGLLGRWLGRHGNAEGNRMAERIMKWGMAGFAATLAAYSSFKASEREEREVVTTPLPTTTEMAAMPNEKIPLSAVHAIDVQAQGKLVENSPAQGLQK